MVDRELVADDWRVHAVVDGALALSVVVLPVQRQFCGVEARPLRRAQVDLQDDHSGAAVNRQV